MKTTLADKKISIISSRWGFILFILCGIIALSTGIIMYGKLIAIDHVLIGMGIVFTSGGTLFLINMRDYYIEIDSEKDIIRILGSDHNKSASLELPIGYFTGIIIQRHLTGRSSGRQRTSRYEISLMSGTGSLLRIADFTDRGKAIAFGKDLQRIFKIDLISEEDSVRRLLMKRMTGTADNLDVPLPEKSRIISIPEGVSNMLHWNCRYTLIQYFIILIIMYGFFHVIYYTVVPSSGNAVISGVLYSCIAVMSCIVASMIVMNVIGTYNLVISSTTIEYFVMFFGKKTGYRSIAKSEIGMIINTIDGHNNTIQIVSIRGLEIMSELIDKLNMRVSPISDLSMVSAIYSIKDELLDINVSSLSMKEKWYIESRILRKS